MPFCITRLQLALLYVVEATGDVGAKALEDYCQQRTRLQLALLYVVETTGDVGAKALEDYCQQRETQDLHADDGFGWKPPPDKDEVM